MSAPTKQQNARRPAQSQGNRVTRYVDHQLEKTRRQVKSNDLVASILLLFVMVIGFLLVAAIVDAWVFTFTPLMRWAALLLLVTSCVVMMVFSIWPLLTKKINPDYAAKMLEDAKPGFRNSLLNYVWFRKKPEVIGGAVFDAVARQAAVDLHSVPDESTVDRSKVIRLGFWLIGVTAAMIAYFMLSPKNPLQTFNRVIFPSADLAKPAVVTISDVTPGNTVVFFGDQVEITAKIYGPHSPEQVQLIYSTNDGRQSGQVRIMEPDPTTPRQYRLNFTENTGGLRESLVYEIVARDGRSGEFQIKVAPRPAITIESIQIDPPKYTKLKSQTIFQGAIDGVEGAIVTVRATANLEIDEATVELLNQLPTLPGEDQKFKPARSPKKMTVDAKNAKATFQLQLDTNREKPFATHYRLNFRSIDGKTPAAPNIYPIRVIPDLAPELEVRAPISAESEVPANGALKVAAVANDVDYEISFVRIQVEHRGNQILNEKLRLKTQAGQRQAPAQYVIRPEELGLTVGDQAIFYITAGDNRTTYFSDTEPAPNVNRSKNYSFTVVEPNTSNDGRRNKSAESNSPPEENKPPEDSKDPKKDQSESGDKGETSDDGAGGSQKNEPDAGEGSKDQPDSGEPSGENDPSEQSNSDGADEQKDESGGPGDSESDPSAGSEDSGTKESESKGAGGGAVEQDSEQESTDGGSGGSETGEDGGDATSKHGGSGTQQQPSDPSSDTSNAKSGNNPSDNAVSQSAPETRDENLTEGERELSEDASEAEQIRQLEKILSENPDRREQQGDSKQAANQEDNNNPQGAEDEGGSGSSPDQKENPNDPSSESGRQDQGSSDSENQPPQKSEPQGAADKEQDSSSQNPQNGNPNDSPEGNPSGNSAEQNPNNQKENNPSNASDSSSDPSGESSSSDSGDPESGDPSAGDKSDNSEQEKSGGDSGDEKSAESPSGQPSGEQPKSGDKPPGDSSPSDSSPSDSSPSDSSPSDSSPSDSPSSEKSSGPPSGENSGEKGKQGQPGGPSDDANSSEADDGQEGSSQAGKGDVGTDVLQREKENREYSRKRIDFVLDKLRSQRHNPDKELLKKMGWDKQRLNDFVDSWDDMKAAAAQGDARAKRQLKRREIATGVTPDDRRRKVVNNGEDAGQLEQDGAVNEVPPDEFHNFNRFLQDLQRTAP